MRITFLGPAHPYRGGLAAFNERLARQFTEEKKDVDIRTFSLQYPRILFPGKTQFTDSPPPEGIRIVRQLNSVNPFNWIRTGIKLKKERPDILLVRFWLPFMAPCLGTVARIVRSNKYTVIISVVDNVIPHEKRPGDRLLTNYFIKSIDGAVTLSSAVRIDLERFRRDIPVIYTPHPLFDNYGKKLDKDAALAKLGLERECSYLLFFGFIRDYKGLDLLLEAFADKRFRNRNMKLIVAGEFYEDQSRYRGIVSQSGIEKEVIFYDHFIKESEVALFFSIADLVVQPYKSATQSGVTQIAYQFEKPMLVTDVGGLREIVRNGKCGYVVKPDIREIADAILDYFENAREKAFTECVRNEKKKFTWNRMSESVTEVFYRCLLKELMRSL